MDGFINNDIFRT